MKRILALLLATGILFTFTACRKVVDYELSGSYTVTDSIQGNDAAAATTDQHTAGQADSDKDISYVTVTDKQGKPMTTCVTVTNRQGETVTTRVTVTDKHGKTLTTYVPVTTYMPVTHTKVNTTAATDKSIGKTTTPPASITATTKKTAITRTTGSTGGDATVQNITLQQLRNIANAGYFSDIYTDKSAYAPGAAAKVTCEVKNPKSASFSGSLELRLVKDGQVKAVKTARLSLNTGDTAAKTLSFTLPQTDLVGYAVEAYIFDKTGTLADADMTAIDCSSDWRVYPRFGFVAGDMRTRTKEQSRSILAELNKHHINTLYFQDMMDTHDTPLAGSVSAPASSYQTLAKATIERQTLLDMLAVSKEMNMQSFAYNLMFGAYGDCESRGVDLDWGLYQGNKGIDAHGPLPGAWESVWLLIMNPGNPSWQNFFAKNMNDFVTAYPFDGIIVDSLGKRGYTLYDKSGKPVQLDDQYAPFLKYLKSYTGKPLLFNPVDGYGYEQTVNLDELDFFYMEVWPWTYKTYYSLFQVIEGYNAANQGEKGISLAAYMNYEYAKSGATHFNEAGVRYTNAVIMAAGGSHMELGDNGMLSSEYYPGNHLSLTASLKAATRNSYSFMTAYEHLLRGKGWQSRACRTTVDGKATSANGAAGKVWAFAKKNTVTGVRTLQTVNLQAVSSDSWVDNGGDQPAPRVQKDTTVRHYIDGAVNTVLCMTPDAYEGIAVEVPFTVGNDATGQYVEYTMPHLEYWTMTVFM